MKPVNWGGYRPGAGRKPIGEPTATIRVPVSQKDAIVTLVQRLKSSPVPRIPDWLELLPLAEQTPSQSFPLMGSLCLPCDLGR